MTLLSTAGDFSFRAGPFRRRMLRFLAACKQSRMVLQFMQGPTQQRTGKKRRNSGDPDCGSLEHDLAEHLNNTFEELCFGNKLHQSMAGVCPHLKFLKRLRRKIRNRRMTCRQNAFSGRTPQLEKSVKRNNRQNRDPYKTYSPHTLFPDPGFAVHAGLTSVKLPKLNDFRATFMK